MILHPLIPLTASLILGIAWQASGAIPWLAMLFIGGLYTFFALAKKIPQQGLFLALALCLFLAGSLRYSQQKTHFNDFYHVTANKKCSAIARVDDIEESYRYPGQTILTLTIKELDHKKEKISQARDMRIQVSTKTPQVVLVGDTIRCSSLFFRESTNKDYKRYLIKEQLGGHLYTKDTLILIERPRWSINRWAVETRNRITKNLKSKLSPTTFTLFASIFLGKKQIDPTQIDPIKEHFKMWGILHYLARSGLHLIIFILLWNWLMGLMPLPLGTKQLTLIALIFGYFALSWASISFMRAIILFVFYKLCILFDLQINALYLLSLACLLVLLHNPFQLFFLDFQLSFALTFALALYSSLKKY